MSTTRAAKRPQRNGQGTVAPSAAAARMPQSAAAPPPFTPIADHAFLRLRSIHE